MKEIGGYIELDNYGMPMLHDGSLALNCGRNCLAYLIKARQIKKILLPQLLGDSIGKVCDRERIKVKHYSIGVDFMPVHIKLEPDEWIYIVNYYGQLNTETLRGLANKYKRVIIDQAQAYFQMPIKGVDTIYVCKKFFGVADGAFLYTDVFFTEDLCRDESHDRIGFLVGRYERTASEFYEKYIMNEELFCNEPIKKMSKLTENMLHGINYDKVKEKRTNNFKYLREQLKDINELQLLVPEGAFMYPLYINEGIRVREKLWRENIYIPILWPNVMEQCKKGELEYKMACNILPLPVDQRYSYSEMDIMVKCIKKYWGKINGK